MRATGPPALARRLAAAVALLASACGDAEPPEPVVDEFAAAAAGTPPAPAGAATRSPAPAGEPPPEPAAAHADAVDTRSPRQVLWSERGGDPHRIDARELFLVESPVEVRARALPSGPPRFKASGEERSSPPDGFGWRRTDDGRVHVEARRGIRGDYAFTRVALLLDPGAGRWCVEAVALWCHSDIPLDPYQRIRAGTVFLDPDPGANRLRVAAAFGADRSWPLGGSFSAELDLARDGEGAPPWSGDDPWLPLEDALWIASEPCPPDATRAERAAWSASHATPDIVTAARRRLPVVAVTPRGRGIRVGAEPGAILPADPPEFRRAGALYNDREWVHVAEPWLEDGRPDPPDDEPVAPADAWLLADGCVFAAFPGDDGHSYGDRGSIDFVLEYRGDRWEVRAVGLTYGDHTLPSLYDPGVDGTVSIRGDVERFRVAFDVRGRVHDGEEFPLRGEFWVVLAEAAVTAPIPFGNELAAAWEALVARVASEKSE